MKRLNLDPLLKKIASRREKAMQLYKNQDCGKHDHRFDCFLDEVPEEWERVQRMRKEGHPLVQGGHYREFKPAKVPSVIKL